MEPIKIRAYKNKYKTSDKHPAFKGKYKGKEAAVWVELDKDGEKCLSITIKDAEERDETAPRQVKPVVPGRWNDLDAGQGDDDAIPF